MVDNLGRFTDVCIGWPGCVHDACVFVNSSLYHRRLQGTLFPDWKQTICGQDISLLVLDEWSCLPSSLMAAQGFYWQWLLISTTETRLSNAHAVVEHAYGKLSMTLTSLRDWNPAEKTLLQEKKPVDQEKKPSGSRRKTRGKNCLALAGKKMIICAKQ